ncbi:hypothetical protein MAMC_00027 [Methylacidimicrobium cyclopophantes]|uniref:Uncharacterized protein n=1 Tax=Methylacidimicrobium cyclopophantes TaxID=1041766 RepID=A0A5E6M4V4_9BACT|nr:hypothetical protein [Methylacidimicrobium cyclopophantes]VVM04353.1 hypothetical protein MAMC_00027 [Methylacidimicrobium cyclopophantes]
MAATAKSRSFLKFFLDSVFLLALLSLGERLLAQEEEEVFTQKEVETEARRYIDQKSQENQGVFLFQDPVENQRIPLLFDRVRLVRSISGYGYFAAVDFHEKGFEPPKPYELDFWYKPRAKKLVLMDIRIHKVPRKEGNGWVLVSRMPVPWWWLPVSEHPGHTEFKRAWEVKAAIHEYLADKIREGGGVLRIKDEKTRQEIPLEFVEIHNPVRRIPDKDYFACTDFREKGEPEKIYDIDFWLAEKNGKLFVDQVKIHKVPEKEDGHWIQVERYSFEADKPIVVP